MKQKPAMVDFLLSKGVNPQVKNQYFASALDFANQYLAKFVFISFFLKKKPINLNENVKI